MLPWKAYTVSISVPLRTPEDTELVLRLIRNEERERQAWMEVLTTQFWSV